MIHILESLICRYIMNWKYKIPLKDKNVFREIEEKYDIEIPDTLKRLVIDANGATPEKYRVMVNNVERVFSVVLSYNRGDADNVYTNLDAFIKQGLLPFGADPFGNQFCIELKSNEVVFWNHEYDKTVPAHSNLSLFINSFY